MSVAEEPELEPTKEIKYPKLRLLTGGKGPPEGPVSDWLSTLKVGTIFACRPSKKTIDWELYLVLFKDDDLILLQWQLPDGKLWDRRVDPKVFSSVHREYKIVGVHNLEPGEGDDNRTD